MAKSEAAAVVAAAELDKWQAAVTAAEDEAAAARAEADRRVAEMQSKLDAADNAHADDIKRVVADDAAKRKAVVNELLHGTDEGREKAIQRLMTQLDSVRAEAAEDVARHKREKQSEVQRVMREKGVEMARATADKREALRRQEVVHGIDLAELQDQMLGARAQAAKSAADAAAAHAALLTQRREWEAKIAIVESDNLAVLDAMRAHHASETRLAARRTLAFARVDAALGRYATRAMGASLRHWRRVAGVARAAARESGMERQHSAALAAERADFTNGANAGSGGGSRGDLDREAAKVEVTEVRGRRRSMSRTARLASVLRRWRTMRLRGFFTHWRLHAVHAAAVQASMGDVRKATQEAWTRVQRAQAEAASATDSARVAYALANNEVESAQARMEDEMEVLRLQVVDLRARLAERDDEIQWLQAVCDSAGARYDKKLKKKTHFADGGKAGAASPPSRWGGSSSSKDSDEIGSGGRDRDRRHGRDRVRSKDKDSPGERRRGEGSRRSKPASKTQSKRDRRGKRSLSRSSTSGSSGKAVDPRERVDALFSGGVVAHAGDAHNDGDSDRGDDGSGDGGSSGDAGDAGEGGSSDGSDAADEVPDPAAAASAAAAAVVAASPDGLLVPGSSGDPYGEFAGDFDMSLLDRLVPVAPPLVPDSSAALGGGSSSASSADGGDDEWASVALERVLSKSNPYADAAADEDEGTAAAAASPGRRMSSGASGAAGGAAQRGGRRSEAERKRSGRRDRGSAAVRAIDDLLASDVYN